MICVHCGADIPDGELVCPNCGAEVQIVPDYNPLEDVLAREVRGSVEGATRQIRTDDIRRYRRENAEQNINSTRVLSQNELDRIREERRTGVRNGAEGSQSQCARRNTGVNARIREKSVVSARIRVIRVECADGRIQRNCAAAGSRSVWRRQSVKEEIF